MRTIAAKYVAPLALGILGMGLFYAGAHVWQDHQVLHALVAEAIQRQQAQQQRPQPAPRAPEGPAK